MNFDMGFCSLNFIRLKNSSNDKKYLLITIYAPCFSNNTIYDGLYLLNYTFTRNLLSGIIWDPWISS